MVMRSKEEDCEKLNLYSRTKWELCEMIIDQVELEAEQARRTRMGIIDYQVDAMWTATDPRNQHMRALYIANAELQGPPYDLTPEYVGLARSTRGTVFNVDE